MKKTIKSQTKKIIPVIVIIGGLAALITLITLRPNLPTNDKPPYIVQEEDVKLSIEDRGVIVLRTIDEQEKKVVQLTVNEEYIDQIYKDQPVNIEFPQLNTPETTGTVYSIADKPLMESEQSMYEVIIRLHSEIDEIREGMHPEITIVLENENDVLAVPNESIYEIDDLYYVDQIIQSPNNTRFSKKTQESIEATEIEIGLEGDTFTEITDGLEEGDIVIAE